MARAKGQNTLKAPGEWPADKVARWPIERLIPYAKNARTRTLLVLMADRLASGFGVLVL